MDVYGMMKRAFEETIGPIRLPPRVMDHVDAKISHLEGRAVGLEAKIDAIDAKIVSPRTEIAALTSALLGEARRLDARIEGLDRHLAAAIEVRERLAALE